MRQLRQLPLRVRTRMRAAAPAHAAEQHEHVFSNTAMAAITIHWGGFFQDLHLPKDTDDAVKRIQGNFSAWMWNYIVISLAIVSFLSYFFNAHLLVVIIVVGITAGILIALKGNTLQVGGVVMGDYHKLGILGVEAFIGLWWTETFNVLLWTLAFSSIVLLAHALCKPTGGATTSFMHKTRDKVEGVVKDVKGMEGLKKSH